MLYVKYSKLQKRSCLKMLTDGHAYTIILSRSLIGPGELMTSQKLLFHHHWWRHLHPREHLQNLSASTEAGACPDNTSTLLTQHKKMGLMSYWVSMFICAVWSGHCLFAPQRGKTYRLTCAHLCSLVGLHCPHVEILYPWLSKMLSVNTLIRLFECAGWSESSLSAHVWRYVCLILWLTG